MCFSSMCPTFSKHVFCRECLSREAADRCSRVPFLCRTSSVYVGWTAVVITQNAVVMPVAVDYANIRGVGKLVYVEGLRLFTVYAIIIVTEFNAELEVCSFRRSLAP